MQLKEILEKYVGKEKVESLVNELKENKVYFSSEENLDIRYGKLKENLDEKNRLYEEAQKHIEELSKGVQSSEELKSEKLEYENLVKALKEENQNMRINNALEKALIKEKAKDVKYLTYEIKDHYQANKTPFEFDADGNLKNIDEMIETVKKKHVNLFEPQVTTKDVEVQNLGKGETNLEAEPKNLLEALYQKYQK